MNIDRIFLAQEFNNKDEVFQFLAKQLQELGIVADSKMYIDALYEREAQGSTGLVDGFAIPHGKSENINDAAIIYIRNQKALEWESLDGNPITDIFALAIPENGNHNHLDSLIAISTKLMDPNVCQQLRASQNEEEIKNIFA